MKESQRWQWLFLALISVLLALSPVQSMPFNSTSVQLQKRECRFDSVEWICDDFFPTTQQVLGHVFQTPDTFNRRWDHAWFWTTNWETADSSWPHESLRWVLAHDYQWVSIFEGVDESWSRAQIDDVRQFDYRYVRHIPPRIDAGYPPRFQDAIYVLNACVSQGFARAVVNPDVFIFIRRYEQPHPESIWMLFELPELTRNPRVHRIWRVDPTCDDSTQAATLYWSRDRGDPIQGSGWWYFSEPEVETESSWGCGFLLGRV